MGNSNLYQKIKSFQEYILISQDSVLVDVYFREPQSDFWVFRSYNSLDDVIHLKSVDVETTLKRCLAPQSTSWFRRRWLGSGCSFLGNASQNYIRHYTASNALVFLIHLPAIHVQLSSLFR